MLIPALVALLWMGAGSAKAHFGERTDSLWGFVARSDLVVIGSVARAYQEEDKGHTPSPGVVRLHVDEVLLGTSAPQIGIVVPGMHQPRYAPGEQVLVFAERSNGIVRSLQSRSEKVSVAGAVDPAVDAVRRYVRIAALKDGSLRAEQLKEFTLELLASTAPRLHQDAVFDLSRDRFSDSMLTDPEIRRVGSLALGEGTPLVVREGIAAKLGKLVARGRSAALDPLARLTVEPANAIVRVAALNALGGSGAAGVEDTIRASIDHDDVYVRLAAVEALSRLRTREAVPAILSRVGDSDRRVRFASLRALYRIGGPEAEAALREIEANASIEDRQLIAQAAAREREPAKETKGTR